MEQPGVLVGLIAPLFRAAASAKSGGAKTACNRNGVRDPKVDGSKVLLEQGSSFAGDPSPATPSIFLRIPATPHDTLKRFWLYR